MNEQSVWAFVFLFASVRNAASLGREPRHPPAYEHGTTEFLAYYTVFSGVTGDIADVAPLLPSTVHHCYYFSDNHVALVKASKLGWRPIQLAGQPSKSKLGAAMKSKDLKARPHTSPYLIQYNYTVYMDTKRDVHDSSTLKLLEKLPRDKFIAMRRHEFFTTPLTAWTEYEEAIKQNRYALQASQMADCIEQKLAEGYNDTAEVHYNTGYIVRDMRSSAVRHFNNDWFQHILDCGIECQVGMYFLRQKYDSIIYSLAHDEAYRR